MKNTQHFRNEKGFRIHEFTVQKMSEAVPNKSTNTDFFFMLVSMFSLKLSKESSHNFIV